MCENSEYLIRQLQTIFFWWLGLACYTFHFNLVYNRITPTILHFIPRAKDFH